MTRAAQAGDLSNQFMIEEAQGEFIILTLSVKNIGDEPQSYFGANQKLVDSSGREYSANSTADMWMNNGNATCDIIPGNQIQVRQQSTSQLALCTTRSRCTTRRSRVARRWTCDPRQGHALIWLLEGPVLDWLGAYLLFGPSPTLR